MIAAFGNNLQGVSMAHNNKHCGVLGFPSIKFMASSACRWPITAVTTLEIAPARTLYSYQDQEHHRRCSLPRDQGTVAPETGICNKGSQLRSCTWSASETIFINRRQMCTCPSQPRALPETRGFFSIKQASFNRYLVATLSEASQMTSYLLVKMKQEG